MTLGGGVYATFELDDLAGTNDQVVISHASGNLDLSGRLEIVNLGGMESGEYRLFAFFLWPD